MRTVFGLLALASAWGQETATYQSSSLDVNGRVLKGPQVTTTTSKTGSVSTERVQSINGRMVPVEEVTERVLRDGPVIVVERTRQRYDQDGRPTPPEVTLVEQESRPEGGTLVRSTTSRRDINGNRQITERSITEIRKTGTSPTGQSRETSETVIERPTINGAMEPVEKRSASKTGSADALKQTTTTYRRGADGFYEATRVVTESQKRMGTTTDQTAEYEIGPSGSLDLHSQTSRRTTKNIDGSETETVDIFGKFVPGTAGTLGTSLKLQEREIVERSPDGNGSVRETLRVQRPTVSDPTVLSTPRVVSETICKGKCHE